MSPNNRVLFIGIGSNDPSFLLPPTVSPAALDAILDKATQSMRDAGYAVTLFLPPLAEGIACLEQELREKEYDVVIVGVGLRTINPLLKYFEDVVNTVVREGKGVRIAFNESIELTLKAAQRALPL